MSQLFWLEVKNTWYKQPIVQRWRSWWCCCCWCWWWWWRSGIYWWCLLRKAGWRVGVQIDAGFQFDLLLPNQIICDIVALVIMVMIWWPLPKQCHCDLWSSCSWDAVLFQKLWELSWQKFYLSVFTWSRMTKVWEAYSPKHISDHGPIMNADDKTEILLSFVDRSIAVFIKETVRSCHSPVVTDLENTLEKLNLVWWKPIWRMQLWCMRKIAAPFQTLTICQIVSTSQL